MQRTDVASFGNMPFAGTHHRNMPRQFAFPAISTEGPKRNKERVSFAEHALRRKTPTGTIAAGYDATPVDEAIAVPAAKHVLVSSLPERVSRSGSIPQTTFDLNHAQRPGIHNTTFPFGMSPTPMMYDGWEFPGGLDSVLNQTLPHQPSGRFYLQHGSTVPTVLASNMQPYLRPTASAGNEFYGQYMPDPAQLYPHRTFDMHSNSQNFEVFRPSYQFPLRMAHSLPTPPPAPHDGQNMFDQDPFPGMTQSILPNQRVDGEMPGSYRQMGWPGMPIVDAKSPKERVETREQMFVWAHYAYTSLLASIQKLRTQEQNPECPQPHRPSIFPKPPLETGFDFSSVLKQQSSRLAKRKPEAIPQPQMPGVIFSPSRRHLHTWAAAGESVPPGRLQSFSDHYTDRYGGPSKKPFMSTMLPYLLGDHTSRLSASNYALDSIAYYCEKSEVPWIEGMLLAGCLAFGLGNYRRAYDWNQLILSRDAQNVRAMSNLAATFLALNMRDEALRMWQQAVKTQPSHFEAVEHLIGLLCSCQKTGEAVKVLEYVEQSLRIVIPDALPLESETDESKSRSSSASYLDALDTPSFDFEEPKVFEGLETTFEPEKNGFGSSGFSIAGSDNGRMLALIHAKGNMLYSLGDNRGAAAAFEEAILIGAGRPADGIKGLIRTILLAFSGQRDGYMTPIEPPQEPILLYPEKAVQTARLIFGPHGRLPGLEYVPEGEKGQNHRAAVSTTSNSLLSLAKIYQDGLSTSGISGGPKTATGVRDILALYYLSLSLQPSPSTANNVGILLASVQQFVAPHFALESSASHNIQIPGVTPGSGIALALSYYNYGLNLDSSHAHLFTNLGSLLKDIGQLKAAVKMYELAVKCDDKFDIALANLANAVKDQGMVGEAIGYYRRAVQANPDFAEAVCGLATALNSVCDWKQRGGVYDVHNLRDRWHVDENGDLIKAEHSRQGSGWMNQVVGIVDKQLKDGVSWGRSVLTPSVIEALSQQLTLLEQAAGYRNLAQKKAAITKRLQEWSGRDWEGSRIVWLIECAVRRIGRQWYRDRYLSGKVYPDHRYARPTLPALLNTPNAPTVLPFHTFTAPLSAKQIRQISHRNGLRISVLNMRSSWLPKPVWPPPAPPNPQLRVGYVSSDFNNHPLAHLMQSVFGMHNPNRVRAYCYATTPSDNSIHRQQIEREAPVFYDTSSWNVEKLVRKIVEDGIHVLVNLNGYTRGARNELFAARPAPVQMSFMGFAGTLGADWCDYILADEISIPKNTLSPYRHKMELEDRLRPESLAEDAEDWMYSENIIYTKSTFFCCDHRQSAPDAANGPPPTSQPERELAWQQEQARRWKMRKELFPNLADDVVIFGNFNQLYKVIPPNPLNP